MFATSRSIIRSKSSSVSALKIMISSSRFRNSGLKRRFTSLITMFSIFLSVSSSFADWKPKWLRFSRYLEKRSHLGFQSANDELTDKKIENMVMSEVKRLFNPEFLNRLDEIIIFNALTDEDLLRIIDLLVANINTNLAQKNISISLTPEAARWILEQTCTDRSYGARPLRRALQRHLEDPLSEALIQGEIQPPAVLEVTVGSEGLYYRPVNDSLVTATPLSH